MECKFNSLEDASSFQLDTNYLIEDDSTIKSHDKKQH